MKMTNTIVLLIFNYFSFTTGEQQYHSNYSKVTFIKRNKFEDIEQDDAEYNQQDYEFTNFTYFGILETLLNFTKEYSDRVSISRLGKSCNSRNISALTIKRPEDSSLIEYTTVLVTGTEKNDWQSVFTSLYIAKRLIQFKDSAKVMFETNTKWVIIPIFNPDLYVDEIEDLPEYYTTCFKNDDFQNYQTVLDKIIETKNIKTLIHLRSATKSITKYMDPMLSLKTKRNKNSQKHNLLKLRTLVMDSFELFSFEVTKNTSVIDTADPFELIKARVQEQTPSAIVLSLQTKQPPESQAQYPNQVDVSMAKTVFEVLKLIQVMFSQKYYGVIDNWNFEIDSYVSGRFPHEKYYTPSSCAKIELHYAPQMLIFISVALI